MPMNLDAVGAVSQPGRNSWTSKDALLYALGVGAGQTDPTGFELEFTTENSQNVAQRVLPTMPVVISMGGGPGLPSWGDFDFRMLLHGEQGVTVHGPIPRRRRGRLGHDDRRHLRQGQGRGRAARDRSRPTSTAASPRSTTRFAAFIRGEGGFGESRGPTRSPTRRRCPTASADHEVTYATRARPGVALPPLAATATRCTPTPTIAKFAGFDRPILHGLCTYGFTGRALLHELCGSDVAKFRSMDARFSKPVMPGRHAHRAACGTTARAARSSRPSTRKAPSSSTAAASSSRNLELRDSTGSRRSRRARRRRRR